MTSLRFQIPVGFRIRQRVQQMDVDAAVSLLSGKKQRKYSQAIRLRQQTVVSLIGHVWECPGCAYRLPAYRRYVLDTRPTLLPEHTPKSVVEAWGTRQLSLFPSDNETLELNRPYPLPSPYTCTRCGREFSVDDRLRDVTVERTAGHIRIACRILSLDELMAVRWRAEAPLPFHTPLYERWTFNLRNGHTVLELVDEQGNKAALPWDITTNPEPAVHGVVYRAITENVRVLRTLKRQFMAVTGAPLPFEEEELTPGHFLLLTRFIGFDRAFYAAIPYAAGSLKLDSSFRAANRHLHTRERALKRLEKSTLPSVKSIRRVYFGKLGLFFYLAECEMLWSCLGDVNLLCRVLRSNRIYDVVAALHQAPGITLFLTDYARVRGAVLLVDDMLHQWETVRRHALLYYSMSERMRLQERRGWQEGHPRMTDIDAEPRFSRPLCVPDEDIRDCTVDGFRFYWLRSSCDYAEAGRQLENCLTEWDSYRNPVVCVSKNGHAVAAVEVCDKMVVQALAHGNTNIGTVRGLPEALERWMEKYGLVQAPERDDDDELPF